MAENKLIKKINSRNWYRQGGTLLPYYPSIPYREAFLLFDGFNWYRKGVNYGYFDRDKEKKIADRILKKQLADRNYFVNKFIKPWQHLKIKQDKFNSKITSGYLSGLSDNELITFHKKFSDQRTSLWKTGILIEVFDPWGEMIINNYLQKYNLVITPNDLAALVGATRLSYMQQELFDRLLLVRDKKNGKDISRKLKQHVDKYFWLKNNYVDISYLDERYFNSLITKEAKKSIMVINKEISELRSLANDLKYRQPKLIKKYKLPKELINLFYLFSLMSDWRDERKAQCYKVNYCGSLFLQELSKRTKISVKHLSYLEAQEITSLAYVKSLKNNLKERVAGCLSYYENNHIFWLVGRSAENLHKKLELSISKSKKITGMVACGGKKVGRVKIIITAKDFNKMKSGDILVTQMTRPEYLPVIRRAGAIITDEGGITCHAAIISRELNIPCIIGTQVATSFLKDGDLVEVDAVKGIIKIIK